MAQKKHIYILGLEPFTERMLHTIEGAEDYEFHQLLSYDEVTGLKNHDMPEMLADARQVLHDREDGVHGILAYWDFPSTCIQPILREQMDLPGPSLETVLKTEHKFWSRQHQQAAAPEVTPAFFPVDPCADVLRQKQLDYPFWIKPIKAHSSVLGFHIDSEEMYLEKAKEICDRIHLFGGPFNFILGMARHLPEEIEKVSGDWCIAEQITGGRQCTLEGYMFNGEVNVYGVIDTLKLPGTSSLARYQYPSLLPEEVQERMIDAAIRIIKEIALENEAFNMEFFWDEQEDEVWVLEINPRISKSHCPLFYLVDGVSHQQVIVRLQESRNPGMPKGQGEWPMAAKFMMREDRDAVCRRVPTAEELQDMEQEFPGTFYRMEAREGHLISELPYQDPYSLETGVIFIGGENQIHIEDRFEKIKKALPLELDYVEGK